MNAATPPSRITTELADTDAPAYWAATIDAALESALLARVLQRLMVQGAVIDQLRYECDEAGDRVRIEVLFRADDEHAHLVARRWETLINVRHVTLCPARVSRACVAARRIRAA